jgi:type II secretory ATPase GspE/PulE/Tfp pilus assembly ATPase PilB-like protein
MDQLLRDWVDRARELGASDIHLEPQENCIRVRLRMDGQLCPLQELEKSLLPPLLLRLKIACGLPTDESQLPLDGKWLPRRDGKSPSIRVSIIPFLHGEGAVLRLLPQIHSGSNLGQLGFDAATAAEISRAIHLPDGLFLVTGPTGCGKTTTIHCLLHALNDGRRKIITAEDPVERSMDGVQSVNISPRHGLGFADALRAMLRQTPNVLFIGEIRDEETAAIGVQAALTGHLVFSTLHCNDTLGAISRLNQLGVAPSLCRGVLGGVLSQRLIRILCPHCKQLSHPGSHWAIRRRFQIPDTTPIFSPGSCPRCSHRGFAGQTTIYEWLPLYQRHSTVGLSTQELARLRRPTLRSSAREKILEGITAIGEAIAPVDG